MATTLHPQSQPSEAATQPRHKLNAIQGLRAVGVLLVVWTHSIIAAGYHSTPWQGGFHFLRSFGACGLDIFFVISGFIVSLVATRGVAQGRGSAGKFLARRITRIFPLYWILTLVVILEAELGRYPIQWHRVPWVPTLLLLPGWHFPVPPLILSLGWSLLFEIYFYLVLATWMRITPAHLVRNTILFLAAMVGLGAIVGIRRPLLVLWSNPVALEFVFGCFIAQIYMRLGTRPDMHVGTRRRLGIVLAAVATALLIVTIFTGYGNASEASVILAGADGWLRVGLWGIPAALLVLGGVLWSPAMRSAPARLLVFLGDASYSIYLCTNPARSLVEHFWRTFGRWGGDVGVLLCLLVCLAAGIVCYLIVERPLMRFFNNWYKRIPFATPANR
ncbi:MAG: acyltransferase [Acidobacteriaceae bacterium]